MPANEELSPRVLDASLEYDSELTYSLNGVLFTGVGYEVMFDGVVSEVSYRAGMQDGLSRDLSPSGEVKGESWFRENVRHGASREFSAGGRLISEELYEYDILVSRTRWDDTGKEIESFRVETSFAVHDRLEWFRREKNWPIPD